MRNVERTTNRTKANTPRSMIQLDTHAISKGLQGSTWYLELVT